MIDGKQFKSISRIKILCAVLFIYLFILQLAKESIQNLRETEQKVKERNAKEVVTQYV